MLSNLAVDVLN